MSNNFFDSPGFLESQDQGANLGLQGLKPETGQLPRRTQLGWQGIAGGSINGGDSAPINL